MLIDATFYAPSLLQLKYLKSKSSIHIQTSAMTPDQEMEVGPGEHYDYNNCKLGRQGKEDKPKNELSQPE